MLRRRVVHLVRPPHGRRRGFRSPLAMYLYMVWNGANPQWAAQLLVLARQVTPRGSAPLLPRCYGAALAARSDYDARVLIR